MSKLSAILLTLAEDECLTLTEIAQRSRLPLSTVHRLVVELSDWLILERSDKGRFRIGEALRLRAGRCPGTGAGAGAAQLAELRDRVAPAMEDLFRETECQVRTGVLRRADVLYVEKTSAAHPVTRFSKAARLPPHATALGKVLLAHSAERVADTAITGDLTQFTPFTVTRPDQLRAIFRTIRADRIGVCDRELTMGWSAIAAPVFGPDRRLVAALELRVPDIARDLPAMRPTLLVAAASLSRELSRTCAAKRPARPALLETMTFRGSCSVG